MNIKNYYILVIVAALIAGAAAFYFYKPHSKQTVPAIQLSNESLKNLTGSNQSPANSVKVKPKMASLSPDQIFAANTRVNQDLASSLKIIESSLNSGQRAFLTLQSIYENSDYKNFFSLNDLDLKLSAEQSRARAENSFLYGRSALMLAQSDAKLNIDDALNKTSVFLDDLNIALNNTKKALGKSASTAAITQVQIDIFGNSVDSALNDILSAKLAVTSSKNALDLARSNPAYQIYQKNVKEYKLVQ